MSANFVEYQHDERNKASQIIEAQKEDVKWTIQLCRSSKLWMGEGLGFFFIFYFLATK